MKFKNTVAILLLASTIFFSCSKQSTSSNNNNPPPVAPIASFIYSGANVAAPATVTFINTSTNATSYSWNFGDNSALSTATSPTHNYTTGGTYNVTLTATGNGTNSYSQSVVILPEPTELQLTVSDNSGVVNGASVYLFTSQSTWLTFVQTSTGTPAFSTTTNSSGVATFLNIAAGTTYYWFAGGCENNVNNSIHSITIIANTLNSSTAVLQNTSSLTINCTNLFNAVNVSVNGGTQYTINAGGYITYYDVLVGTQYTIVAYDPTNTSTQTKYVTPNTCGGNATVNVNP